MTFPGCIDRLVSAAELPEDQSGGSFDWALIERSLGNLALPRDYKALVERFPDGKFAEAITVVRPGAKKGDPEDFLGYYRHRLNDMRAWRADGDGVFPYPIFPEPNGLLPWGEGPRGELFFWLTDSADSDSWTVVWADVDFTEWHSFSGGVCQFLLEVVLGEVAPLATAEATTAPSAKGFRVFRSKVRQELPRGVVQDAYRWGSRMPSNEFPELANALGSPAVKPEARNWEDLERQLGIPFPGDYKSFIDKFGVGIFCDVRIYAPAAPSGFDMVELMRRQGARAAGLPSAVRSALYPEPVALIAWGETADGWTINWKAGGTDPNQWGVAMIAPNFQPVFFDDFSFSAFLLKYSGQQSQLGVSFARSPWTGGVTFVPGVAAG
ncbi:SMI1/KNR4 family protein [Micromonospora sp. NPDC005367]|uniref:SMI1/KNR4 family protein n=1 Tax=Micromonospora sp. NPDC005367 TaxID=3155590 RepID=UPI0033A38119